MQFVILRLLFNPSLQGLFQKLIPRKGLMGQLNSVLLSKPKSNFSFVFGCGLGVYVLCSGTKIKTN